MNVMQSVAKYVYELKSGSKQTVKDDDDNRHVIAGNEVDAGTRDSAGIESVNLGTSSNSNYRENAVKINLDGRDMRNLLKETRASKFTRILEKFPTLENYSYMSDFTNMLTESGKEVDMIDSFEILLYFYDRR